MGSTNNRTSVSEGINPLLKIILTVYKESGEDATILLIEGCNLQIGSYSSFFEWLDTKLEE